MLVGIGMIIWFIIVIIFGGWYKLAKDEVDREVINSREKVSKEITNESEKKIQTAELEEIKSKISELKKDHKMPT